MISNESHQSYYRLSIYWLIFSMSICFAQLYFGTGLFFITISSSIFLLFPFVIYIYYSMESVGAYLISATYIKLFFISQIVKIIYAQPADTFLAAPEETVVALLSGLVGFLLAALLISAMGKRWQIPIMKPLHDPIFMDKFAVSIIIFVLISVVLRNILDIDAVINLEDSSDESPIAGLAVWNYIRGLLPLSVAILTARRLITTEGKKYIDIRIIFSLIICIFIGLLTNSRTDIFSGIVAWGCVYFMYGGRINLYLIIFMVFMLYVANNIVFPLINIQRSLPNWLSFSEYISETFSIAGKIVSESNIEEIASYNNIYGGVSSRQYYGVETGFLDRFTPNQLDEVVHYVVNNEPLGWHFFLNQVEKIVPNSIYNYVGYIPHEPGTLLIQKTLTPFANYSSPNYGIIAESYIYYENIGIIFLMPMFMALFFYCLHAIYGGIKNNYMSAYCVTIYLFTIADSSLADPLGKLPGQGLICIAIYSLARFFWGQGASRADGVKSQIN